MEDFMKKERFVAFFDAVMAIIMTIVVLDINKRITSLMRLFFNFCVF